jgi:hypothetical protein
MKATLEFNLPEERDEHLRAVHASDAWAALHDIDYMLRNHLKHGPTFNTADDMAQEVRRQINEALQLLDE